MLFPLAVALSVVALLAGPLVAAAARRHDWAMAMLDGATLGLIPTLIVARLLPHVALESGAFAVGAFVVGFALCAAIEARSHSDVTAAEAFVLPPLAVHAFFDGAALAVAFSAGPSGAVQATLGGALVFHKLPEGLFVGSAYVPTRGLRTGLARAALLGGATVGGALVGRELLAHAPAMMVHLALAFGLGAMLRIMTHSHGEPSARPSLSAVSGASFVACAAAVIALPSPQRILFTAQPHELPVARALVPLFLETAPWALLALTADALLRRTTSWARAIDFLAIGVMLPLFGLRAACLIAAAQVLFAWHGRGAELAPSGQPLRSYVAGVIVCVGAEAALPMDAFAHERLLALASALLLVVPWLRGAGAASCAALLVHKGAPPALMLSALLAVSVIPWLRHPRVVFSVGLLIGIAVAVHLHVPQLHSIGAHVHHAYEWLSAGAVAVVATSDIVRTGPRRWFALAGRPNKTLAAPASCN